MTVFGLRVAVYPNDHRPAHVHVIGNGCEAVFMLHCPNGPPELRENFGFNQKVVSKIMSEIFANVSLLCIKCKQIHGNY